MAIEKKNLASCAEIRADGYEVIRALRPICLRHPAAQSSAQPVVRITAKPSWPDVVATVHVKGRRNIFRKNSTEVQRLRFAVGISSLNQLAPFTVSFLAATVQTISCITCQSFAFAPKLMKLIQNLHEGIINRCFQTIFLAGSLATLFLSTGVHAFVFVWRVSCVVCVRVVIVVCV